MGNNDQLHHKRKALSKKSLRRDETKVREHKKRALLICEDSHSSPNYFAKLSAHLGLSKAEIVVRGKECGSDPKTLIEYGQEVLKNDADFDYCFFVFDRDEHSTYDLDLALDIINGMKKKRSYKNITINPITSLPCFELWLKLHFSDSSRPYRRAGKKSAADLLISNLKKIPVFRNYKKDKNCSYFEGIIPHIETAVTNADILLKGGTPHRTDPSTCIHHLYETFKEIADHNKK